MADTLAFDKFLCDANLQMFKDKFVSEGVERVRDITDVSDDTLTGFGMSKTQIQRLRRLFKLWQLETSMSKPSDQSIPPKTKEVEGRVNVHVPLNFFNSTGGNILQISRKPLEKRYSKLWYSNPNSLKQTLNNSFILAMCYERDRDFNNIRLLEDWARKERERRISVLLSIHPCDVNLAKESVYIKQKSVPWMWNQLKKNYPMAATLSADTKTFSGSAAKDILFYYDGVKELEESVNRVLKMAEDGLSETTDSGMKMKESFKGAHQWYSEVLPQITELQNRVATDLARISTLKAIVVSKYHMEETVKVIAERKRKKNARKEKRKKLKQTESSLNSSSTKSIGQKGQKLVSYFAKTDTVDEAQVNSQCKANTMGEDGSSVINEDMVSEESVSLQASTQCKPNTMGEDDSSVINEDMVSKESVSLQASTQCKPNTMGEDDSSVINEDMVSEESVSLQASTQCKPNSEEIYVTSDVSEGMAAKECTSLHQNFEEKWDIFDNQSEIGTDSSETDSDSSADEFSAIDPLHEDNVEYI